MANIDAMLYEIRKKEAEEKAKREAEQNKAETEPVTKDVPEKSVEPVESPEPEKISEPTEKEPESVKKQEKESRPGDGQSGENVSDEADEGNTVSSKAETKAVGEKKEVPAVETDGADVSAEKKKRSHRKKKDPIPEQDVSKTVYAYNSGRRMGRPNTVEDTYVRVNIPASLVAMASSQVLTASSNSAAVAAWMYAKSDKTVDVPDEVKALAGMYRGDQTVNILQEMDGTLTAMNDFIRKMYNILRNGDGEMWYMMAYLMLERMGEIKSPLFDHMALDLPVFESFKAEFRKQYRTVAERERLREGAKRTPKIDPK